MKKRLIILGVIIIIIVVTLFLLKGRTFELQFTENQIKEAISKKLPFERNYFLIFKIILQNPRLTLIDGSDRIMVGLDVTLNVKLANQSKPIGGTIDASGSFSYKSEKGEFYLSNPNIEKFNIQGLPPELTNKGNTIIAKAIGEFYSDKPIYRMKTDDLKQATAKAIVKSITVKNKVVYVTLGI